MRAGLTVTKDGPKLNFFDENEKNRAILAALKDGPGLSLCDVNEKSITSLVLTKDGPMLGLSDESGRPRAFLKVVKEGPALGLFDNQRCRVNLGVGRITTPDGKTVEYPESSLLLFNPDGKVRWQAP
jgi:hypothetical protein